MRGVSFDVLEGEFWDVGESIGKSTLSRLLGWVEEPDSDKFYLRILASSR